MLVKKYRLVKDKDFEMVFKRGKSFFSKIIILRTAKNNLDVSRFGIIVSTKTAKKATQRNKIKRWIREAIRLDLSKLKTGFDCVLIARPTILTTKPKVDYQEIKKTLGYLFKRSRLFK